VLQAGTYRVRVGIQTKPDKGVFQLAVDGLNIAQPQDEYIGLPYDVRDLGLVSVPVAGNHAFTFTVQSKDIGSSGYTLAFDYIELVPE
jgi:hypothetical protein